MDAVPRLQELLADPGKVSLVPAEAIPAMLGELERLRATLWARLTVPPSNGRVPPEGDRLLEVKEASEILGISQDALYRGKFPFKVRVGGRVRFSLLGIQRYIRQRTGQ